MRKILILFAHPKEQKSKINKYLINAVEDMENVTVNRLYEQYPDFFIDIKREQELILEHDIIIWHHPFYWYSAPAIIKEWMDLVLEHGFAYGSEGNDLQGKYIMNSITTGGRESSYEEGGLNRFPINQFLLPFNQAAHLCKMKYLPPFVVHGVHLLQDHDVKSYQLQYQRVIDFLRTEELNDIELSKLSYITQQVK